MQHTLQFKHQPEELPTTSTSGYLPIHEVPEWTGNSATDENIHPLEHVESEIIIADDEFNKNNFLTPEDFTEGAILARKKVASKEEYSRLVNYVNLISIYLK